jgi:hypothetical protein
MNKLINKIWYGMKIFFSVFADWRVILCLLISLAIFFFYNYFQFRQEAQRVESARIQSEQNRIAEQARADEQYRLREETKPTQKIYVQPKPTPSTRSTDFPMATPIDTSVPELIPFDPPTFNTGIPDNWSGDRPQNLWGR